MYLQLSSIQTQIRNFNRLKYQTSNSNHKSSNTIQIHMFNRLVGKAIVKSRIIRLLTSRCNLLTSHKHNKNQVIGSKMSLEAQRFRHISKLIIPNGKCNNKCNNLSLRLNTKRILNLDKNKQFRIRDKQLTKELQNRKEMKTRRRNNLRVKKIAVTMKVVAAHTNQNQNRNNPCRNNNLNKTSHNKSQLAVVIKMFAVEAKLVLLNRYLLLRHKLKETLDQIRILLLLLNLKAASNR